MPYFPPAIDLTAPGPIGSVTPSTGAFTTLTANGATTVTGASFGLSGNISAAAWTTAGIRYSNVAATLTDTSSSGTVATVYNDVWGGNTNAASSATTYTQAYGSYFKTPVVGTNVTFTNKSALGADTVSIGGASQSTFALAVTGTANISSSVTANQVFAPGGVSPGGGSFGALIAQHDAEFVFTNQNSTQTAFFHVPSTATFSLGKLDAAAPVAQTLGVQGVVAGTSNTAGANWTFAGSQGTGTGAGGSLIFQTAPAGSTGTAQNALATALTIDSTQKITIASGKVLQLGNAATTGLTAGVLAALTNATIVISDSTGQAYRIPCII